MVGPCALCFPVKAGSDVEHSRIFIYLGGPISAPSAPVQFWGGRFSAVISLDKGPLRLCAQLRRSTSVYHLYLEEGPRAVSSTGGQWEAGREQTCKILSNP